MSTRMRCLHIERTFLKIPNSCVESEPLLAFLVMGSVKAPNFTHWITMRLTPP